MTSILAALVIKVALGVYIHSFEPKTSRFIRCEYVGRELIGFRAKTQDDLDERFARVALKKGGNAVNVVWRQKRETKPVRFRGRGIIYKCPAEVLAQLGEEVSD